LGSHSAIPLFAKEWKGSPATPKLILAFIPFNWKHRTTA